MQAADPPHDASTRLAKSNGSAEEAFAVIDFAWRGGRRRADLVRSRRFRQGTILPDGEGWRFAAVGGLSAYLLEPGNSARAEQVPARYMFSFRSGEQLELTLILRGAVLPAGSAFVITFHDLGGRLLRKLPLRLRNGRTVHEIACPPLPGRAAIAIRLKGEGRLTLIKARLVSPPPASSSDAVRAVPALFDADLYAEQARAFADQSPAAWDHYVVHGEAAGLRPHQWFDPAWYRARWMKGLPRRVNAFLNFLARAPTENVRPHPLFETNWYRGAHACPAGDPLTHFLDVAATPGRHPNQAWDTAARLSQPVPTSLGVLDQPAPSTRKRPFKTTRDAVHDDVEAARLIQLAEDAEATLIHVIVLATGDEGAMSRGLNGLRRQSHPRLRVTLVGPAGEALDAATRLMPEADIVAVVEGQHLAGINTALAGSHAPLIAYLEPDVVWDARHLAVLAAAISEGDAGMVFGSYAVRERSTRERFIGEPFSREMQLLQNTPPLSMILHRNGGTYASARLNSALGPHAPRAYVTDLAAALEPRWTPVILAEMDENRAPEQNETDARVELQWLGLMAQQLLNWSASADSDAPFLRATIVIEARGALRALFDTLASVLLVQSSPQDYEIVIVENGADARDIALLFEWSRLFPQVRVIRTLKQLGTPFGYNVGALAARGHHLVFLQAGIILNEGWLDVLLAAAEAPGMAAAAATIIHPDASPALGDGAIAAARDGFSRDRLVSGGCMAVSAAEFRNVGGFDACLTHGPFAEDLARRLRLRTGDEIAVAPLQLVMRTAPEPVFPMQDAASGLFAERWGTDAASTGAGDEIDQHVAPASRVPRRPPDLRSGSLARLRIAIKISMAGEPDANSGDLQFATSLAQAFSRLGHICRVDRTTDWYAAPEIDDVVLTLRGRYAYRPSPRHLNLMWLISHPAAVGSAEIAAYDHVFAASPRLAARLARAHQRTSISPLLQCTDPAIFSPGPPLQPPSRIVFVGNSRLVDRPIVAAAIRELVPLDIYGQHWDRFAAAPFVCAESIPNRELGRLYRSAIVLNDHWNDMRADGIVSNRLFDACACASPVISDTLPELAELFGDLVACFDPDRPLTPLIAAALNEDAEQRARRRTLARVIAEHHSFDARAAEIVRVATTRLDQLSARSLI